MNPCADPTSSIGVSKYEMAIEHVATRTNGFENDALF